MGSTERIWTVNDEIKFIDAMVSGCYANAPLGRNKESLTKEQKKIKLKNYINSIFNRRWDCNIPLKDCESYAQGLLRNL